METIKGESGGGLVTITFDERANPIKVDIDDSIFKLKDKQFVSDLFIGAIRDFNNKFDAMIKERLPSLKNFNLPGK